MSHGQQYSGVAVAEVMTIQGMSSPAQSLLAANSRRHQPRRRHEHPHHRRSREIRGDAVYGLPELRDEVPLAF